MWPFWPLIWQQQQESHSTGCHFPLLPLRMHATQKFIFSCVWVHNKSTSLYFVKQMFVIIFIKPPCFLYIATFVLSFESASLSFHPSAFFFQPLCCILKVSNHETCLIAVLYHILLYFTSLKSLSLHQLNLDIPCNSLSLLQNVAGIHVLAFGDKSLQSRFSFNLYYALHRGKIWLSTCIDYLVTVVNW
jgi:hypothetical protein